MNVLIACEESQEVCKAFRARGHNAFSCDLQECSGGHPEWHIRGNVLGLLSPSDYGANEPAEIAFITDDLKYHCIVCPWDLIIAHPPCTDLAVSGARYFARKRADGSQARGAAFFMEFTRADCPRIVIENPIGIMSTVYRKPDQIIQPYMFGDPYEKRTCLWLKGVKPLIPTNIVEPPPRKEYDSGRTMPAWYADAWRLPKEERSRFRSKTFPGIARAMAEQWG